jgi:hypothetical protein
MEGSTKVSVDRSRVYTSEHDFYELHGSVSMKLSPAAAMDVCRSAASRGLVVTRVEGGIWRNPGFESRLDCIWDGVDPPVDLERASVNNVAAAMFVATKSRDHDVFILTAPSQGFFRSRIREASDQEL